MTRIGVDGHVLTGKFQGTRTTLSRLLRAVAEQIGDRSLIVYSDDPREARALLSSPPYEFAALGHAGSLRRLLHVLPSAFRRDRIDLGVFQYIAPLTGRHLVFVHDILPITHPQYFPWRMRLQLGLFLRLSVKRAAMVVAVSEYTRRELELRLGISPDRLRVVLNGPSFEPTVFDTPYRPASDRYILTVGRIEQRKNIPLLVEAFQKAAVPGVRLVIVGTHDAGFDYVLPDDPMIEWRRGIDDAALIDLYRGAGLFVYPSAAEGFGMPLLDALLFGLPVISSDRTAMAEVGADLADFFDPESPDATGILADRIRGHFGIAPISPPSDAARIALAARFDWNRSAIDFLNAVDDATAHRSR